MNSSAELTSRLVRYQLDDNQSGIESEEHIIVIGAGPVGVRFAQELLKRQPLCRITLFGNEPSQPYNRVQLSSLLAGDVSYEDILMPLPDTARYSGFQFKVCTIKSIDHENHRVIDTFGRIHTYTKLVIATGARAHQPNIPGLEQDGVFTFRNIKDTESLSSRIGRARHIVVVGGGLLGLEAARALLKANTRITLVQQGSRLMNRQLDDEGADLLQSKVEALGIRVIINSGVREILGDGRVTGVLTRDKEQIDCDTVLLCAGIKPNKEIALHSHIPVGQGIKVDDQLLTRVPDVYAIGECCEHRGTTYGLVNPGFEQAAICAEVIVNGSARYIGSIEVSRLKVLGEKICSMGEVAEVHPRPRLYMARFRRKKQGIYRKIVIYKGLLVGALGYGSWDESRRIQEAYNNHRRVWPWQLLWFLFTGKLFFGGSAGSVKQWPASTVVCQCNNIAQGMLIDAVEAGCESIKSLQQKTGAGTVCGSCIPLLEQLSTAGIREKDSAWLPTGILSIAAAAIVAAVLSLPAMSVSDSVQSISGVEQLWNDKFWKQVTGFSLLGMSVLGLLMSLRKKLKSKRLGKYTYWRLFHIALGALCAATLILHTGLHLGENFNRWLMVNFLSVLVLGALAGVVVSISHVLSSETSRKLRKFWQWAHLLVTWPLPLLLAVHIVTVYYF
ncbi:MAG: FAD-dependent oxidoreductase [Pseudomonadales bacterium]|nr:FAD-dependent oxidoreductase [Pseudomonadales bacterium]